MTALQTTILAWGGAALLMNATLTATPAQASEAIAKRAACMVCHAVDSKGIGPSFREIAARHQGDAGATALLEQRVRKGSVGVWGQLPMAATPTSQLNDADLKTVVAWIRGLAE